MASILERSRDNFVDRDITKKRIEILVKEYNLPTDHDRLNQSSPGIGSVSDAYFNKFLSKETKTKIKKIKELYGLEQFEFIHELKSLVFIDKKISNKIFSPKFVNQIKNMADVIGYEKKDIIQYMIRTDFSGIKSPIIKNISEKKIVFSQDVKDAKLMPRLFFQNVSENPSLYGRERSSNGVKNITDYITWGRPGRTPYKGAQYVASGRTDNQELGFLEDFWGTPQEFLTGNEGEVGFYEAKARLEYVNGNLPPFLKKRLEDVFKTLDVWRKEEKEIEQECGQLRLESGACVRFDDKLDLEKSIQERLPFSEKEYKNLYDFLDRGFKAPSQSSNLIGKGIETLFDFMTKNKEEYDKELRNLEYLTSHKKELSTEEIKILERKIKDILNPFEIMESIYKTPRGVYFSNPVLHGGARGEDAKGWEPRTFALRDNVFYRVEKNGKENYINVKEYHLGVLDDDLKIRLYSFSHKPSPKNLGENGLSLEIERNGRNKFLDIKETESFLNELKKRTLITLFLKAPREQMSEAAR